MQDFHGAARQLEERVLELSTRVFGEQHPNTLTSMNDLAITLYLTGDKNGAAQLLRESIKVLGENHPDTFSAQENLKIIEKQ